MQSRRADEPLVPLADLEVAGQIADALKRSQRTSTRTVDEIVAAFGEPEATEAARRRAAAALHMARVRLDPDIHFVARGEPVTMSPARSRRQRAAIPLGTAMVFAFGVASFVFSLGTGGSDPTRSGSGVSSAADQSYVPVPPPPGLVGAAPTVPTPATTPTPAAPATPSHTPPRHAATRSRNVSVRLLPPAARATFVCVDDGHGHTLFRGNLTRPRRFQGRRIRINVGLASATVLVNGHALVLHTSPDGYDITRHGNKRLALGRRPCSG